MKFNNPSSWINETQKRENPPSLIFLVAYFLDHCKNKRKWEGGENHRIFLS